MRRALLSRNKSRTARPARAHDRAIFFSLSDIGQRAYSLRTAAICQSTRRKYLKRSRPGTRHAKRVSAVASSSERDRGRGRGSLIDRPNVGTLRVCLIDYFCLWDGTVGINEPRLLGDCYRRVLIGVSNRT